MKLSINLIIIIIISFFFSCEKVKQEEDRSYTGRKFELFLPYTDTIKHGQWIKLDTILFVHDQYLLTQYIDGAKPAGKELIPVNFHIPLKTSEYVMYKSPERDWKELASNNEIMLELAMKLLSIKNKEESIYQITSGPKLLFEGKLELWKRDSSLIEIKLSKDHPFVVKKLK